MEHTFEEDLEKRLQNPIFKKEWDKLDTSILVLSCDAYDDILNIFFYFKEKNWANCPFPVYITTETRKSKYGVSLNHDYPFEQWTNRIKEALLAIPTKYVILMDSDFFIRQPVDQDRIDYCIENFDEDTATFSFELEYAPTSPSDKNGFRLKPNQSPYLNSCQPSIWDKDKLIQRLEDGKNAWEWELTIVDTPYKHYVNCGDLIIDIGYYQHNQFHTNYGLRRAQWVKSDVLDLFEKEGIQIDYSIRGFYEET